MANYKTYVYILFFSCLSFMSKADTLYDDDLQMLVKEMNSLLPLDATNEFFKRYNTDLNVTVQFESLFLKGYELNVVYRYGGITKDNLIEDSNTLYRDLKNYYIANLKSSVIISEFWEDVVSTLWYQGGSIKYTLLFSDNYSVIVDIPSEELENIDDFITASENTKLAFIYKNYFEDIKFPMKFSDDERVTAITYNDDFWIEYRELAWELFNEFTNREKQATLHDNLLDSFNITNPALAAIFISTDLDYKFIFSNTRNKKTFEIVLKREDIYKHYGNIWHHRIESIGKSLSL